MDLKNSDELIFSIDLLTKKEGYNYETYISNIKENKSALIVKVADTLSNLEQSIKDCNLKFILKYNNQLKLLTN